MPEMRWTLLAPSLAGGSAALSNEQNTTTNTTGITATTSDPSGGVASFSIMNPWFVVYVWKRVS